MMEGVAINRFAEGANYRFASTRKAAEQGHAGAQYNLGIMYVQGRGVAQNDATAVSWYRKAAEQGHARAQYGHGIMYAKGRGVARSDATAVSWYRKAGEQGHAGAQFNLGDMYAKGRGVAQNYATAVSWYRKAAEQGHAGAQLGLGIMYAKGKGVAQNDATAVSWYRKAVSRYRKAAEQGDADAQFGLGLMYATGRGVARSDATAVSWFRKAAEQGHAGAQRNLGAMLQAGIGATDAGAAATGPSAEERQHAKAALQAASNTVRAAEGGASATPASIGNLRQAIAAAHQLGHVGTKKEEKLLARVLRLKELLEARGGARRCGVCVCACVRALGGSHAGESIACGLCTHCPPDPAHASLAAAPRPATAPHTPAASRTGRRCGPESAAARRRRPLALPRRSRPPAEECPRAWRRSWRR